MPQVCPENAIFVKHYFWLGICQMLQPSGHVPDLAAFGRGHLPDEVCAMLLRDRTTKRNVYWATDFYESLGEGYGFFDMITSKTMGQNGCLDMTPMSERSDEEKRRRIRDIGEVCTPAWMCNKMINVADEQWFGRSGSFNTELILPGGGQGWAPTYHVEFPNGKKWRDYVGELRFEMACGKAPFLVSRRDVSTGEYIAVPNRIGILDRKMRVVGENTSDYDEWLAAAQLAYKSVYGCEWQGENVYLAREALLLSFLDYHVACFGMMPDECVLLRMADIISWNIWQMDILTGMLPDVCKNGRRHFRPVHSMIMDWAKGKSIRFISIKGGTANVVEEGGCDECRY